jgi:hypothetical protein
MALPAPWLSLLRGRQDAERDAEREEEPESSIDSDEERSLVCAVCGNGITSHSAAAEINGAHAHTCVNPHGYVYEIGCFSSAPGCIDLGSPTSEHTWFPGFSWCFSVCGRCEAHLGWRFSSGGGEVFWGLILKHLKEAD